MKNIGIEIIKRVSGFGAVLDTHGKTWGIKYVANISDHEDDCDPEQPSNMPDDVWIDMEDEIMGACYADAYRRIDEAQADQMDAELASDPTADDETDAEACLRYMVSAAERVVETWIVGDLAGAVRALNVARRTARKVLGVEEPPLVEPERLDPGHLPEGHPDRRVSTLNGVARLARDLRCTVGEAVLIARALRR